MYIEQKKWTIGTYAGAGGARGPCAPPHLGKKFRPEMSKRGEKVSPRYVGKKECALSLKYDKIKTKKLGEKEENSKRKGLKLKK